MGPKDEGTPPILTSNLIDVWKKKRNFHPTLFSLLLFIGLLKIIRERRDQADRKVRENICGTPSPYEGKRDGKWGRPVVKRNKKRIMSAITFPLFLFICLIIFFLFSLLFGRYVFSLTVSPNNVKIVKEKMRPRLDLKSFLLFFSPCPVLSSLLLIIWTRRVKKRKD